MAEKRVVIVNEVIGEDSNSNYHTPLSNYENHYTYTPHIIKNEKPAQPMGQNIFYYGHESSNSAKGSASNEKENETPQ